MTCPSDPIKKAQWIENMSASMKGTRMGSDNPFFGHHHSAETRAKMAEARLGKNRSKETIAKLSASAKKYAKEHPEFITTLLANCQRLPIRVAKSEQYGIINDPDYILQYADFIRSASYMYPDEDVEKTITEYLQLYEISIPELEIFLNFSIGWSIDSLCHLSGRSLKEMKKILKKFSQFEQNVDHYLNPDVDQFPRCINNKERELEFSSDMISGQF